jgi:uncharacterized protein YggE
MATITVFGYGEVSVPPDEARVDLSVRTVAATPGEALRNVAERARALVQLLDELEIPPEKRSTSGIWVDEVEPYAEGGRDGGYQASERLNVALPTESVATLLDAATSRADAHVEGPRLVIAPDNPARNQALRVAAENAHARAESLASGLGMRLGSVVEAHEGGTAYPTTQTAGFGPLAPLPVEPPIEASRATVVAAISVTFEVEPA